MTLSQDSGCTLARGNGPSSLPQKVIPLAHVCGEDSCPLPPSQLCILFCPSSPFKIKVLPAHDASKVRASGPGLNASGIPASLPVEFTIDARDAGEGLLTVQILVSARLAHLPGQAPAQAGLNLCFSSGP